eukprot:scaffold1954_cov268-Pinguiococcus_pyrenoidosus.AAC.52
MRPPESSSPPRRVPTFQVCASLRLGRGISCAEQDVISDRLGREGPPLWWAHEAVCSTRKWSSAPASRRQARPGLGQCARSATAGNRGAPRHAAAAGAPVAVRVPEDVADSDRATRAKETDFLCVPATYVRAVAHSARARQRSVGGPSAEASQPPGGELACALRGQGVAILQVAGRVSGGGKETGGGQGEYLGVPLEATPPHLFSPV